MSRESDRFPTDHPNPRIASEQAADAVEAMGVKVMSVRLPQVHGPHDHGFVPITIAIAREKGVAAYVGEGKNRWPAVHRLDAARLYRLALEKGTAGARYNAVGEEGVTLRALEEAIGRHLNMPVVSITPEEAADYYGWFAAFAADGHAGLERVDAEDAGLAADRPRSDERPRKRGLLPDMRRAGGGAMPPRPLSGKGEGRRNGLEGFLDPADEQIATAMSADALPTRSAAGNPVAGAAAPRAEHKFTQHAETDIFPAIDAELAAENVDQLPLCPKRSEFRMVVEDRAACRSDDPPRDQEALVPIDLHPTQRRDEDISQKTENVPFDVACADVVDIRLPQLGLGRDGNVFFRGEIAEERPLRHFDAVDQLIEGRCREPLRCEQLKRRIGECAAGAELFPLPQGQRGIGGGGGFSRLQSCFRIA